ncbi:hypothetical protein DL93DRAFT_1974041 [Clavulina sp. PMI_390]|nr:hypothetical protein DL93DRAFT_1974041 [Clavulina sp. PMI_390]
MSTTSGKPPSYTPYDDEDNASETTSTTREGSKERAVYVYYRLYRDDGPVTSQQGAATGRGDGIGWVRVGDLPPPCTVRGFKRCVARQEGFDVTVIRDVFLSHSDETGVEDGARLNLFVGAPGTDTSKEINLVLHEETAHTSPNIDQTSFSAISSLSGAQSGEVPSNWAAWWTIDKISGYGNPKTSGQDPHLIEASSEVMAFAPPPGWARATLSQTGVYRSTLQGPRIAFDDNHVALPLRIRKWDMLYVDLEPNEERKAAPGELVNSSI